MDLFDIAVIGAGPVGLMTALHASKKHRVLLLALEEPDRKAISRIESVPIALLGLLVEHGVHPSSIGATTAFDRTITSWNMNQPATFSTRNTAHLHRNSLEYALWGVVMREARIAIRIGCQELTLTGDRSANGADWFARRVIDATGRTALTAQQKTKLSQPWVARSFILSSERVFDGTFQLAVLPDGYVYRLGSETLQTIVFVGRASAVQGTPDELENLLASAQVEWMMNSLPRLAEFDSTDAGVVSLQWASSSRSILIGDAALSRDILSSQGLACGLSEGMYAATLNNDRSIDLFIQRQAEQRHLHRKTLSKQLMRHRYCKRAVWEEYRQFVEMSGEPSAQDSRIALKMERIGYEAQTKGS